MTYWLTLLVAIGLLIVSICHGDFLAAIIAACMVWILLVWQDK